MKKKNIIGKRNDSGRGCNKNQLDIFYSFSLSNLNVDGTQTKPNDNSVDANISAENFGGAYLLLAISDRDY